MASIYDRPPTPGQVIQVLILEPYQMTIEQLRERLGLEHVRSFSSRMTVDMALRLSKLTGTSPNIWLDLQRDVDLYDERQTLADALDKIEPFPAPLQMRKLPAAGDATE